MAKLYSRNLGVAKEAVRLMKIYHIKRFRSQNALFCFLEDIKFPFNKFHRFNTMPVYAGDKNYMPIISFLREAGVLKRDIVGNGETGRIHYTVLKYEI